METLCLEASRPHFNALVLNSWDSGVHMGSVMLFKVCGITLNMMKHTEELWEITFYDKKPFTGEASGSYADD